MFCQYCGRQIPDNSVVCPACGAQLKTPKRKGDNNLILYIICGVLGLAVLGGLGYLCYNLMADKKTDSDKIVMPAPPPPTPGEAMKVVSSVLNLRSAASETSSKVCGLYFGSELEVLNYSPEWSYVRVTTPAQYAGTEGYVATRYLITPEEYSQICALFDKSMREKAKYQSYIFLPLLQYCSKKYASNYISTWYVIDLRYDSSGTYYYIRNRHSGEERIIEYKGVINGSPVFNDYSI